MPRNEEGEYELVLGTPQLLSLVFIVIVLLGIVFSAGYYLGRSTAGDIAAGEQAGKRAPAANAEKAVTPPPPAAPAASAGPALEAGQSLEPGEVKVAPGGAPSAEAAKTPATAPASGPPPAQSQAVQPQQAQPLASPPSTTQATSEAASYPEPAPGQTFLQVAALRRTEAELLVDVLKRKGFPALVAPGPSETLFRVLVGPLKEEEEIARMRRRLEDAGFRSSYVRKY